MENIEVRSYLDWEPYFNLNDIFSDTNSMFSLLTENNKLYWLESRSQENGRVTIVQYDPKSKDKHFSLPAPYNARTRVHEYGGRPYTVYKNTIYFANFADQRLYKYNPNRDDSPVPLTPELNQDGSLGKYAAPLVIMDGRFLVFVYEKEYRDRENHNSIAYIPLPSPDEQSPSLREPQILIEKNDFYGDIAYHDATQSLAFLTWNHPNMPWNSTELWETKLKQVSQKTLQPSSPQKIIGENNQAICSVTYTLTGDLVFALDEPGHPDNHYKNWWNIHIYSNSKVIPLTQDLMEYGFPMWGVGMKTIFPLREHELLAIRRNQGKDELILLSNKTKTLLPLPFTEILGLSVLSSQKIVLVGSAPTILESLIIYDLVTHKYETIQQATTLTINQEAISIPQLIAFKTENNETAYGYFYPPKNPNYKAPSNELPPLMVKVHGGPTARARTSLSLPLQYWTSQGFAVFDIDHRGSTGYGRNYRDKLLGNWGIVDMQDIAHAIHYLQAHGYVSKQVVIRGGSAGGYAVQRALTLYPELFSAGASYFGIGNLETLAKLTHKFESRYLDQLLGGSLKDNPLVYYDRSPINYLHNLKSPMILFQGLEDKVVTPEVSQEIVQALKQNNIFYEYVEYEGEAHGFRKKETNIDALTRESRFFKKILKQVTS